MGHATPRMTETVYTRLFKKDDQSAEMGKLGAIATRKRRPGGNVVPFTRKAGG